MAPSISRLKFNQHGKFSPLSSPHADTSQPPTQLLQQPILAQELVQPTNPMSWSVELTFGSILELTQPTISSSNRPREILKLNCDHCTKKDCFKYQLKLSFYEASWFFVIKHGFPRTLKFSVAWNLPHKSFLQRLPERWGGAWGEGWHMNLIWLSGHIEWTFIDSRLDIIDILAVQTALKRTKLDNIGLLPQCTSRGIFRAGSPRNEVLDCNETQLAVAYIAMQFQILKLEIGKHGRGLWKVWEWAFHKIYPYIFFEVSSSHPLL